MQFMVNVNRLIAKVGIPALLAIYFIFLSYDVAKWDDGGRSRIVDVHNANIANINNVDAVVLGGSNAFFSLSADYLREITNLTWYNAALLNEGFSDSNYHNFVTSLFDESSRANIKIVVYSTIHPFRVGEIEKRSSFVGPVEGMRDASVKPDISALKYIKALIKKDTVRLKYPEPEKFGDFEFKKFDCGPIPENDLKFEREDVEIASNAMSESIVFFQRLFPNAKIVVVFPSEFYGDEFDDTIAINFNRKLEKGVSRSVQAKDIAGVNRVSFVSQPVFDNSDLICDAKHHANKKGREWRTLNLALQL